MSRENRLLTVSESGQGLADLWRSPLKPVKRVIDVGSRPSLEKIAASDEFLDRLIPGYLREMVNGQVTALRVDAWIGGKLDQEFLAPLAVLIIEKDVYNGTAKEKEAGTHWEQIINLRKVEAIKQGLIGEDDRILIYLEADNTPDSKGVLVHRYVLPEHLRRKGLGRAFYLNLEAVLKESGFEYICGYNGNAAIRFFLNLGRYEVVQLKPEFLRERLLDACDINTIKFLDRRVEVEAVRPEFLRS